MHEVSHADPLEPEASKDVVQEVLRGPPLGHAQFLVHHLIELVFERFQRERHPAHSTLGGDDLELLVLVEDAAHHEIGQGDGVGLEEHRGRDRQIALKAELHPGGVEGVEDAAAAEVEVEDLLGWSLGCSQNGAQRSCR